MACVPRLPWHVGKFGLVPGSYLFLLPGYSPELNPDEWVWKNVKAMAAHHDAELARAALCMAIAVRGGAVAGVVFHTDQGGEYTAQLFADACRRAGVTQSMGRTGSALDTA